MTEKIFFNILLIVFMGLAAAACVAILFVTVPYGRHSRKGWGRLVSGKLGWFLMESPSLFIFVVVFFFSPYNRSFPALLFFMFWVVHYGQRSLLYPQLIRSHQKSVPLSVIVMAFVFTSVNGYVNGRWLYKFSGGYSVEWMTDPRFLIGAFLFIAGLVVNIQSDHLLRILRGKGESGYKIPRGGLFRYVSCANYFGEIVEWFGWALATWSLPGLAFALWSVANLAPRARSHHLWYRKTFPDYPPDRKALIPFIF